MKGYLVKRILATIPVMMVVAIFVFSLLRLTPGDQAAIIAGDSPIPKTSCRSARSWVWTSRCIGHS